MLLQRTLMVSLKLVGQLLCDLLVKFKSLLSKVLVCDDGELLLTDGKLLMSPGSDT